MRVRRPKDTDGPAYRWGDVGGRTNHPVDPAGAIFGKTHWPVAMPHERDNVKNKTKWDETRKAAVLSEMATPVKEVKPVSKHFTTGDNVKYRGEKCKVVNQNGNWVTIDCSGAVYKVYADILTVGNERPVVTTPKAAAQEDVNKVLEGCNTRAQYLKAVAKWPTVVEYVNELDFTTLGAGMLKMRIGNKLRGAMRK